MAAKFPERYSGGPSLGPGERTVGVKQDKKRKAILAVLHAASEHMTSTDISEELMSRGIDAGERTVRLYLARLRDEGLCAAIGRGYELTRLGINEVAASTALERVGFLSTKIDEMTYRMSFDLSSRAGTVVVNTSIATIEELRASSKEIMQVFEKGYAMGTLLTLLAPGERVGRTVVPEGSLGFCTVCSITLNGVLLKHGIPVRSRFAGLLELKNGRPTRFVELIMYEGTSIDPLEIFIKSGMTDYLGAIRTGNGLIGASFREVPAESRGMVVNLADKLAKVGLGAFMEIGHSGSSLYGVPVGERHAGTVIVGGLNPISVVEEMGNRLSSKAMSGLLEYGRLFHYSKLPKMLKV